LEFLQLLRFAEHERSMGRRTVLFIDEIHRFNRAQQDALLPHVEAGVVTLVGATTENPSFAVNAAVLSRAQVVRLDPLRVEDLVLEQ
jgi:putative ATPase